MSGETDLASEYWRLYSSTPDRTPSAQWVRLAVENATRLLEAISSYTVHLAGKQYLATVQKGGGKLGLYEGGQATFVRTYFTFSTAAFRLEHQMNPAQVDRTKWNFNLALSSPRGWGESDLALSESLGWLRKYLCDLQDTMQWQDQACGWTVMHALGEAAGSTCRYDSMKCVVIQIDPAEFTWPIIPTELVAGLRHVVERLARIADSADKICHPQGPSRSVEFSPSALAAELGVSEGTLNKYAKAAGVETPARGARNHRYSGDDAVRICEQFATSSDEKKTREKAKSLVVKLTKTAR